MSKISNIEAVQVLDSRGNPTVSVKITSSCGKEGLAFVPSGASTGENEALELRDQNPNCYLGKSVQTAIGNILGPIKEELIGREVTSQQAIDKLLLELDGTPNKSRLGANALLGVSLAACITGAKAAGLPLYRYIGGTHTSTLPCPMMNVINGGAHSDSPLNFQEFMIRPVGMPTFSEAVRCGTEIFHTLKKLLKEKGLSTSVGDEGGFAPALSSDEEALQILLQAIEKAGYKPGEEVSLALDCAASEFFNKTTGKYEDKKQKKLGQPYQERSNEEQVVYLKQLCEKFPIDSIEDGLDENDWEGWSYLTAALGEKIQIVGDDLFVTNRKFLQRGIQEKSANSILIKVNQIGTLTETLETISLAKAHGFTNVISHRSGETEDSFIADLAVGVASGQIKTGSLSRSDRNAKYNRLLWIEHELAGGGSFADSNLKNPRQKRAGELIGL